jgi:hypothetical protein
MQLVYKFVSAILASSVLANPVEANVSIIFFFFAFKFQLLMISRFSQTDEAEVVCTNPALLQQNLGRWVLVLPFTITGIDS